MAGGSLGSLVVDVIARVGGFVDGLSKAERESKKFRANVEKNLKATGTAFVALGLAGAAATALLIKRSIDNADALLEQSQAYGVNIEQLSAYQLGLEKAGSNSAEFATGLKGLANAVDANSEAFTRLQISTKNSDGSLKDSNKLLEEIADRFASMPDGITKTALAQDMLGKSGVKLIPFLNQGSAGLAQMREEAERLGLVISQETAEAADQFNDNLATLKATITGTGNELTTALLPKMVEFTDTLNDPATQQGIKDIVAGLAEMAIQLTKIVTLIPNVTRFLSEELSAFFNGAALGDIPRLTEELDALQEKLNDPMTAKLFTPERIAEWEAEKVRLQTLIALSEEFAQSQAAQTQTGKVDRTAPAANTPFTPGVIDKEAETAAQKLNDLIKDRLTSYREQIELQGQSTELAKLQAEIATGKFAGASPENLDLLQAEAMYADSIAAEIELKSLIDDRVASYGNVINALGEMSEVAKLNFDIAQGAFPSASEEDIARMRAYAESVDAIAWADKRREANEAFAEMQAGLEKQIALIGETSEAAALLYDIEHGGYDQFSEDQQDKLLLLAQELEAREAMQKEIDAAAKAQQKIMEDLVENTQSILADFLKGSFDDGLKGAADRFKKMLADMAAEAVAADIMKWVVGFGKNQATGVSSAGNWGDTAGGVIKAFAGFFDTGGNIGAGQWGIAGENGAEIIRGPANITSTKDTAAMMGKGGDTNNVTFVFPNVTNKQEAQQAGSAAARQFNRMQGGAGRYG